MKRPRKLKIGVTLFLREGAQSIWENGIFQNSFFLINLLQKSPAVGETFLVNGGVGKPEEAGDFLALAPAPVIDMTRAAQNLDVIIDAGWIKKDEVCQGVKPGTVKVCG